MALNRALFASVIGLVAVCSAQATAILTVDFTFPRTAVVDTYLSFNIDTGSLYNAFDFSDPMLSQLVANLVRAAPSQIRFGGGAANDVTYTGAGGASGNCSQGGVTRICVDDSLWAAVNSFANRTGARLVWDLSINPRTEGGAWNSSNSEALIARTVAAGYTIEAWQLGNEEGGWCSQGGSRVQQTVGGRQSLQNRCCRRHDQARRELLCRAGASVIRCLQSVSTAATPAVWQCRRLLRTSTLCAASSSLLPAPLSAPQSTAQTRAAIRFLTLPGSSSPSLVRQGRDGP